MNEEIKKGDKVVVYIPEMEVKLYGKVDQHFEEEPYGECYHIKTHDATWCFEESANVIVVKDEE